MNSNFSPLNAMRCALPVCLAAVDSVDALNGSEVGDCSMFLEVDDFSMSLEMVGCGDGGRAGGNVVSIGLMDWNAKMWQK